MVDRSALEGRTDAPIEESTRDEPGPDQIWLRASAEGEHRLERSPVQLAATGLLGGFDVSIGTLAMVVTGGALVGATGDQLALLVAALAFGVGLAIISIGRSELFTENFLVPMIALVRHRGSIRQLLRLWVLTLAGNALGIVLLGLVLAASGVVDAYQRPAFVAIVVEKLLAGTVVETLGSAILAGIVMTLFTWLLHATTDDAARIVLAFAVGALLVAPPLTHVVVAAAEVTLGVIGGVSMQAGDVAGTLVVALVGNVIGGVGFITLARSAQVLSWPSGRG